ncbi:hypothetical protein BJV82DRAFT_392877 [Fennellomyces sp. T-0311]|nr:hypothetical protein BJV82DRAFT_392877 [Fennellomyces sp. T-0311]
MHNFQTSDTLDETIKQPYDRFKQEYDRIDADPYLNQKQKATAKAKAFVEYIKELTRIRDIVKLVKSPMKLGRATRGKKASKGDTSSPSPPTPTRNYLVASGPNVSQWNPSAVAPTSSGRSLNFVAPAGPPWSSQSPLNPNVVNANQIPRNLPIHQTISPTYDPWNPYGIGSSSMVPADLNVRTPTNEMQHLRITDTPTPIQLKDEPLVCPRKRDKKKDKCPRKHKKVRSMNTGHACRVQGCNVRFGRQRDEPRHFHSIHRNQTFRCLVCHKEFTRLDSLNRHKNARVPCKKKNLGRTMTA